jgi:putative hemolysin
MRPALIVPDTTSVLRLLDQFRQERHHMAVVVDEYGSVEGLVSVTDVVGAIIGDLPEAGEALHEGGVRRADGSWLIDGMMPVDEAETFLGVKNMKNCADYHTLAGFVIDKLGRPSQGRRLLSLENLRFEVVDMDGRRVDKVLVLPLEGGDQEID